MQSGWALSVLRTLTQLAVGYAASWLASHGLGLSDDVRGQAATGVTLALILGWVAGVRWLETRRGTGGWARLARGLGRVLMLGIGAQPAYVPPGGAVQAQSGAAGVSAVTVDAPEHLHAIRPGSPASARTVSGTGPGGVTATWLAGRGDDTA